MSKQTKIIAIVGGVLILAVVLFTMFKVPGGLKGAFGCAGKQEGKSRPGISAAEWKVNDCLKFGYVLKRDAKGAIQGKNEKDPTGKCDVILGARCAKDATFKKVNEPICKKLAATEE